jgi:hypothetical protein
MMRTLMLRDLLAAIAAACIADLLVGQPKSPAILTSVFVCPGCNGQTPLANAHERL